MKAQIKMFETIAVLIIFFFLIAFGIVFYGMIKTKGITEESEKLLQTKSVILSQKVSYLSELDCSQTAIQKENCFDKYKVHAFSKLVAQNKEYYFPIFGFSKVVIQQIFPKEQEYIIYNNPKERYSNSLMTPIPIVIFDETASRLGKYYFGILEVTMYD